ncbi:MAG: ATP-binding protein, partial [Bacilli bacterium]
MIVDVPIKMYIKNSDLSVVLGNILDNAIESNILVDKNERYIDLKILFTENRLTIACVNATNNKITVNPAGLVDTTKKDKENHGFGLVSIKNVCEKYNGIVSIDSKNKKFTVKCIFFV